MGIIATLEELENFDMKEVTIGQMKRPENKNSKQGSTPWRAAIKYKGEPLRIQTGMMYLPFSYENDPTNTSLTFCTKSSNMTPEEIQYADKLIDVLKKIQDTAFENSKENAQEWFSKSPEAFSDSPDSFTVPLRITADGRYPPHLKVKYYRAEDGLPQFPIYDGKTNQLKHSRQQPDPNLRCCDVFAQNTRHIMIIDCMGVWSLNTLKL